ncbi:MAG: serine hydrolase [Bacteroidales bacterium]|nr:serine hydrolase [Bacteroidales bacterium]
MVERSSNLDLEEFVEKYLFTPLGIDHFVWKKMKSGDFAAASGLRLCSRDLMKFGMLYRNKGVWNNHQLISSRWVEASFVQRIAFPSKAVDASDYYGYQFWIWPDTIKGNQLKMISAIGNGGQLINWNPENDIIIVITAGNYNEWIPGKDSYALARNEIYPVLLSSD